MTVEAAPYLVQQRAPGLTRRDWIGLAAVVLGQAVVGALLGLLWLAWSPDSVVYRIPTTTGGSVLIPDQTENWVAADGRFLVLTALAGLVAGILTWFLLRRLRGPLGLIAAAAGALLGAWVTSQVGHLASSGSNNGPLQTALHAQLSLHGWPMLMVQVFLAALSYTALAGFANDPGLGVTPPATYSEQPIQSQPIQSQPIQSQPMPSQPMPSQPIQSQPMPDVEPRDSAGPAAGPES